MNSDGLAEQVFCLFFRKNARIRAKTHREKGEISGALRGYGIQFFVCLQ